MLLVCAKYLRPVNASLIYADTILAGCIMYTARRFSLQKDTLQVLGMR